MRDFPNADPLTGGETTPTFSYLCPSASWHYHNSHFSSSLLKTKDDPFSRRGVLTIKSPVRCNLFPSSTWFDLVNISMVQGENVFVHRLILYLCFLILFICLFCQILRDIYDNTMRRFCSFHFGDLLSGEFIVPILPWSVLYEHTSLTGNISCLIHMHAFLTCA